MSKINEAQEILIAFGLPKAQQNEISALTLLALCSIKNESSWADAQRSSMRITKEIMTFVNQEYKHEQPYAPNTRETFRRQVLHQFTQACLTEYNPDTPNLPVNSPRAHYALSPEALEVIQSYQTEQWEEKLNAFIANVGTLADKHQMNREIHQIPVVISDKEYRLSPGKHNEVQAAIIHEFAPRFAPGAKVLYLGDTAIKTSMWIQKH